MNNNAVILLSGGLDSATVLAIAKSSGFNLYCISFDYGQKHNIELECSKQLAKHLGPVTEHKIVSIDLTAFQSSALISNIPIPKHKNINHLNDGHIPVTYVPARNTIFLSYALGYAEVINADYIMIGANAVDYSNYPDCRPEYIAAYQKMANLALAKTVSGKSINIEAPLIQMTKAQIIKTGLKLGVNYALTMSCYNGTVIGRACGACDACLLRRSAFEQVGAIDPLSYLENPI